MPPEGARLLAAALAEVRPAEARDAARPGARLARQPGAAGTPGRGARRAGSRNRRRRTWADALVGGLRRLPARPQGSRSVTSGASPPSWQASPRRWTTPISGPGDRVPEPLAAAGAQVGGRRPWLRRGATATARTGNWLWAVLVGATLLVMEFILFAALVPTAWSERVRDTELAWLQEGLGPSDHGERRRRARRALVRDALRLAGAGRDQLPHHPAER